MLDLNVITISNNRHQIIIKYAKFRVFIYDGECLYLKKIHINFAIFFDLPKSTISNKLKDNGVTLRKLGEKV